jgi:glycosyltransferase involved in cell wall biosynthesis
MSAAHKCSVVYSPFDVARAQDLDRGACRARLVAELGCRPDSLLVGYFGNLVQRKRPLSFIDTIAAIRHRAPELNAIGVLFGKALDGLEPVVRARAEELGIADRIHLMGFRYPGEPWMAALDLLVVTAVDEPLGRTLVEAMLLGTPVIAADSGGNPEAIRHKETGLLVRADSPDAFAEAAIALSRAPAMRASIVEEAKQDAAARFGVERHVTSITSIYSSLLQPERAKGA